MSSFLKLQGHNHWTKLECDVRRVIHTLADRRIWYFGPSCRTRCQRSGNHADFCDLKKRMKHDWWLWRALFVHILHALLVVLLKLHFTVSYRSLSMFGVWMWAHSCNSAYLTTSFSTVYVRYSVELIKTLTFAVIFVCDCGCCLP